MDADKLFGGAFDVDRCPLKGHNKCQSVVRQGHTPAVFVVHSNKKCVKFICSVRSQGDVANSTLVSVSVCVCVCVCVRVYLVIVYLC